MISASINKPASPRNESLDALRGFAILAMVLSGSIAFGGILPAWMYHAQVPPPDHKFIPTLPGITWVDLVFPFFLFSMGAAIPLALRKAGQEKQPHLQVLWIAVRRAIQLIWFALFLYHMRAWVISPTPGPKEHLLSIAAFFLLFFQFYEGQAKWWPVVKIAAFGLGLTLLAVLPFHEGKGFLLEKSDIIILVLANMAFFGTLIYWFTRHHPWLRVGVLPFVMAIFLAGKENGSINQAIFDFTPIPWAYKFYYLKYLFIIIPGTFAGEWMLQSSPVKKEANDAPTLGWLPAFVLLISNTALLFGRHLVLNLVLSITGLLLLIFLYRNQRRSLDWKLIRAAAYLLPLGLMLEAYEGGIKKDPSTYSYYFVTSGLAMLLLLVLNAWQRIKVLQPFVHFLGSNGRNPMVAYVAGSLLLTPLLALTNLQTSFNLLNSNAFTGFLKGLIYTGLVSWITVWFVRKKWFWKT